MRKNLQPSNYIMNKMEFKESAGFPDFGYCFNLFNKINKLLKLLDDHSDCCCRMPLKELG